MREEHEEKNRKKVVEWEKVRSTSGRRQTVQTSYEIADFRFWTGKESRWEVTCLDLC